jgi:hypothetical protein
LVVGQIGEINMNERKAIYLDDAIDAINDLPNCPNGYSDAYDKASIISALEEVPSAQQWIPVTERLPEDIRPVIVTWRNTDPASYYQYIVGKRFIGVAHYKSGKWYWYSSTTEDFLAEYGRYDGEEFDEAIEVLAWCELPQPYKGEQE